jgi:coiled-coil domain-containing protein 151
LDLDRNASGADENPQMRHIRILESKLDKAMIKYNEAISIKKTYELIAKRLKDERVGYSNQLAAIEQGLKGKNRDYAELVLLQHDAMHSKELSGKELKEFYDQSSKIESLRNEEILHQKIASESRAKLATQLLENKKVTSEKKYEATKKNMATDSSKEENYKPGKFEADKQSLMDYEEAMRRIKEATGVTDVNEIIQKFSTQEDTTRNLFEQRRLNETKLTELNEEKLKLQAYVNRIRVKGIKETRKEEIEGKEKTVDSMNAKFENIKYETEQLESVFTGIYAGITHLYIHLPKYIKFDSEINDIKEDNIKDCLSTVNEKISEFYKFY